MAAPWDAEPGYANLPAVILIGLCMLLLIRSANESATVDAIMGADQALAIGRDGLPARFAKVHPRTMTPVNNTVIVAIFAALLAAFVPLDKSTDIVSIGTLTAFIVVSVGAIILRLRGPDLPRTFKVSGYPVTPILSVLACRYILASYRWNTWISFSGWVAMALIFCLLWGRHHSALNHGMPSQPLEGS